MDGWDDAYDANMDMKKTFLFFMSPFTPVWPISARMAAVTPCRFSVFAMVEEGSSTQLSRINSVSEMIWMR